LTGLKDALARPLSHVKQTFAAIACDATALPLTVHLERQGTAAPAEPVGLFQLLGKGSTPGSTTRTLALTGQDGYAAFPSAGPGKYRLNAVHMEPVEGAWLGKATGRRS
jgi:hypothetical protein